MGMDKLCEMVNSKNAMSYDFGEMLTQYMGVVTSEQSTNDAVKRGVVSDVLSDGQISYKEVTSSSQLAMAKDHWMSMGGDAKGESVITKYAFIQAMRRFCSEASACFKDISACKPAKEEKVIQICKDVLDAHFKLRDKDSKNNEPLLTSFVKTADYLHNCRTAKNPDKVAACIRKKTEAKKTDIDKCFKK